MIEDTKNKVENNRFPRPSAGEEEERDLSTAVLQSNLQSLEIDKKPALPLEDEDADLVRRAQAGDQLAFSALFEKHHSRIFSTCYKMLRNKSEVEDAVQHAFLEAWRCLPRFEGRSRFSTWLTRVAINTCFGFRRRVKRLFFSETYAEKADRNTAWAEHPPSPDEIVVSDAMREAIYAILDKMSTRKRVAFILADLEGRTAPEISDILGVPEATVRTRLFHARRDFALKAKQHEEFCDLFDFSGRNLKGGRK
jgi:RNA polymerase sigma-70 factor, ECF subfamily